METSEYQPRREGLNGTPLVLPPNFPVHGEHVTLSFCAITSGVYAIPYSGNDLIVHTAGFPL
jgi:hypothetical protein